MVPAVQPGVERRRGQSAQPERAEDRLPVETRPHPRGADGHPRELRAGRRVQGREDWQKEGAADLAALSPARRGAPAARRRSGERRGPAVSDPAFGRQRQVELHRLARAPAHRAHEGRGDGLRFDHRRHRPAHPRPADPRHHQAVRAGGRHGGPRRALGRPAQVHRRGQEDHHFHGTEVPVHPRRDRGRAPRAQVRHRDRRGPFEPGRAHVGGGFDGTLRGGHRGRRRDAGGQDQPADGGQEAAVQRQLLRLHRHAQEQDARNLRRARSANRRHP